MELPDTTSGISLVLACSIKIQPGGNLEVPLECTQQLTDQMDIRIDTGFHHKNPNIYVTQLRSGEDPELRNTLENASYQGGRAANDLTIPQPKVMAAYGLYGPATAKQIKDEMRQMHTYCNKGPLDLEEASFPVNLSVNAAGVPPTASA